MSDVCDKLNNFILLVSRDKIKRDIKSEVEPDEY